jgi:hypothetical protein
MHFYSGEAVPLGSKGDIRILINLPEQLIVTLCTLPGVLSLYECSMNDFVSTFVRMICSISQLSKIPGCATNTNV